MGIVDIDGIVLVVVVVVAVDGGGGNVRAPEFEFFSCLFVEFDFIPNHFLGFNAQRDFDGISFSF